MQTWDSIWKNMDSKYKKYYSSGQPQTFVQFSTMMSSQHIEETIFPKIEGLNLLECGSGRADISNYFATKRKYKVTCVDISEPSLKMARENFHQEGNPGNFVQGSVKTIPFGNGTFDIAFCVVLLELFEDVQSVVNEMVRVLKPGGIFLAAILSRKRNIMTVTQAMYKGVVAPVIILRSAFRGEIKAGWQKIDHMFEQPYFTNSYSLVQYKEFAEMAGLIEVKTEGVVPFPTLPSLPPWFESLYLKVVRTITWLRKRLRKTHPWVCNANWSVFWYVYGRQNG